MQAVISSCPCLSELVLSSVTSGSMQVRFLWLHETLESLCNPSVVSSSSGLSNRAWIAVIEQVSTASQRDCVLKALSWKGKGFWADSSAAANFSRPSSCGKGGKFLGYAVYCVPPPILCCWLLAPKYKQALVERVGAAWRCVGRTQDVSMLCSPHKAAQAVCSKKYHVYQ